VLIDDNPHYAIECAEAGIDVLLYDWMHEYPWSKTECGYVAARTPAASHMLRGRLFLSFAF
jgi:D-mannonate dehydratase